MGCLGQSAQARGSKPAKCQNHLVGVGVGWEEGRAAEMAKFGGPGDSRFSSGAVMGCEVGAGGALSHRGSFSGLQG